MCMIFFFNKPFMFSGHSTRITRHTLVLHEILSCVDIHSRNFLCFIIFINNVVIIIGNFNTTSWFSWTSFTDTWFDTESIYEYEWEIRKFLYTVKSQSNLQNGQDVLLYMEMFEAVNVK